MGPRGPRCRGIPHAGAGWGIGSSFGTFVPVEVAGGASGLFSTAQQLGGALGVALLGTVFFGYLDGGHSFETALTHTAPYAMGAFALCAVLSMLLPRTAVSEEALTES